MDESTSLGFMSEKKPELYKTEMCRNWEEMGQCRYGKKCCFAHGRPELRTVQRHALYKTQICRTYHLTGTCHYGVRCTFIHDDTPPAGAAATETATAAVAQTPLTVGTDASQQSHSLYQYTPRASASAPCIALATSPSYCTNSYSSSNLAKTNATTAATNVTMVSPTISCSSLTSAGSSTGLPSPRLSSAAITTPRDSLDLAPNTSSPSLTPFYPPPSLPSLPPTLFLPSAPKKYASPSPSASSIGSAVLATPTHHSWLATTNPGFSSIWASKPAEFAQDDEHIATYTPLF